MASVLRNANSLLMYFPRVIALATCAIFNFTTFAACYSSWNGLGIDAALHARDLDGQLYTRGFVHDESSPYRIESRSLVRRALSPTYIQQKIKEIVSETMAMHRGDLPQSAQRELGISGTPSNIVETHKDQLKNFLSSERVKHDWHVETLERENRADEAARYRKAANAWDKTFGYHFVWVGTEPFSHKLLADHLSGSTAATGLSEGKSGGRKRPLDQGTSGSSGSGEQGTASVKKTSTKGSSLKKGFLD